jgi:hypothetical protein
MGVIGMVMVVEMGRVRVRHAAEENGRPFRQSGLFCQNATGGTNVIVLHFAGVHVAPRARRSAKK